jgi:4-coumarate--CoA ligase (photoactive yellow protein activation family)
MPDDAAFLLTDPMTWWADEHVVRRFVADLIAGELKHLRPGRAATLPPLPWDGSVHLERDLGADSLERLALATSLAEAVRLAESDTEDRLLGAARIADWTAIAQEGLRRYASTMSFRTSGSTGKPKSCTHALDLLAQETRELAPLFRGRSRVLSAVSSRHIYGFLFTILLPRVLGIAAAPLIDLRASSPARLCKEMRAGDLIVAYPEFWRLACRLVPRFPPGVVGVTAAGPCPPALAQELLDRGIERLVQIYGATETAGVGWRTQPDAPYCLFSYWQRVAGDADGLLRTLPDGRAVRYALQDRLHWHGEERFEPAGRLDHAVQIAGVNVFPVRVRDILLRHPDVLDATVRPMRSDEGDRLKALIVPRDRHADTVALQARIDAWMAMHLSALETPKAISFAADLPRDEAGKPADWVIEPHARMI